VPPPDGRGAAFGFVFTICSVPVILAGLEAGRLDDPVGPARSFFCIFFGFVVSFPFSFPTSLWKNGPFSYTFLGPACKGYLRLLCLCPLYLSEHPNVPLLLGHPFRGGALFTSHGVLMILVHRDCLPSAADSCHKGKVVAVQSVRTSLGMRLLRPRLVDPPRC